MVATFFLSKTQEISPEEVSDPTSSISPAHLSPESLMRMPLWMNFVIFILGTGVFTQLGSLLLQWKKLDNELISQRNNIDLDRDGKLKIEQLEKEALKARLRDIKTIAEVHLSFLKKTESLDKGEIDVLIRGYESIISLYQDAPVTTGITKLP